MKTIVALFLDSKQRDCLIETLKSPYFEHSIGGYFIEVTLPQFAFLID